MHIDKNDVTYCGLIFVVKGEGMPIKDGGDRRNKKRGDLLVTLNIDFPSSFTDRQKQTLREILQ